MNNPIPNHLRPYITEAIKSGLRDADAILNFALDRCNALLGEMYEGRTRRSAIVTHEMMLVTWADANDHRV